MNVLAIGCHPDDVEVYCAGTLIKCVKRGDKVTSCHVTNGNMGHVVIEPDELGKMRVEEAKKSGELAGIKVVTCDVGDCLVDSSNKELRDKIVDIIREADPDFIITHSPNDYMADHNEVSKLVFDASFFATVPHYKTKVQKTARCVPIYYMATAKEINFAPTEYVNITDEIELKLDMLRCHESQLIWLRDHDGIDITDSVRITSKFRGYQCNCDYAEGFEQCMVDGKIVPKRLLP